MTKENKKRTMGSGDKRIDFGHSAHKSVGGRGVNDKTLQQSWFELHVACQELMVGIYVDFQRKKNALKMLFRKGGKE